MRRAPINRWLIDLICREHNTPLSFLWPQSRIVLRYQKDDFEVSRPRPSSPASVFPLIRRVLRNVSGFALIKIEKWKIYIGGNVQLYSPGAQPESEHFRFFCCFSFKAPCLIAMAFLIKSQACVVVCLRNNYPFLSRLLVVSSIYLANERRGRTWWRTCWYLSVSISGFLRVCD